MTNFTKNTMIAAAALLVAAGVAGAQTIKAEVPFGFRAAGTALPAGSYEVRASRLAGGSLVFKLTNEDSSHQVMTVPFAKGPQKSGDTPVALTFECTGADCVLVEVAPGTGQAYGITRPKLKSENTHVAVIRAVLLNAE